MLFNVKEEYLKSFVRIQSPSSIGNFPTVPEGRLNNVHPMYAFSNTDRINTIIEVINFMLGD